MGQQVPGTKEIKYKTKDGIPIAYIFYDLKGKNRFPTEPSNEAKVNAMFEMTLSEIDAHPDQISEIKGFNNKYKYRFTVMHKRKIEEQNVRNSLSLTAASTAFILQNHATMEAENKSEGKKIRLQEKLKEIEQSKSSIKIALNALDKLISDQKSHYQFIEIQGISRMLAVLEKQIKLNLEGYKTNFGNQIDLLRFIKAFSSHHPKEFYCDIENKPDYGNTILKTFHPVCTPVTAYCLSLLEDYIWRAEDCKSILSILKEYAKKENYSSFLLVFTQTLQNTNNILMVFYILKFVNEVIAGTVQENDRAILRAELNESKYSFIIEAIKMRLEQYFYKLENSTFINVSQQIFKYASKGKKQYQNSIQNPETIVRNTLSMKDLQQQLVMSFFDMGGAKEEEAEKEAEENEDEFMIVYLSESSTKEFNRVILDVVSQIRSYYKLQTYMMASFKEQEQGDEEKQKMVVGNKLDDLKQEEYLKYIRSNCIKNDCTSEMLNIFKNFQYLEKNQIKKLDSLILEEMGVNKKGSSDQVQTLKKGLKEKQDLIKKLLKENIDLKSQVAAKAKANVPDQILEKQPSLPAPPSLSNSGFPLLPPPPSLSDTLAKPNSLTENTVNTASLLPNLPPPPSLSSLSGFLPPPPPPPPTDNINNGSTSNFASLLPPPPSLDSISFLPPPPPTLDNQLGLPPPPPSLNGTFGILPPPPSLSDSLGTLPPPPPTFSGTLGTLPPPPSFSGLGTLPPPPSFSDISNSLPPPPSLSGIPGLPPPPLGLPTMSGLPGLGFGPVQTQKLKQKQKPNVPLKNCNYAVLSHDKIQGTVWSQVNDEKIVIDKSEIESLFAKKVEEPKQLKTQSLIKLPSEQKKQPVKLLGGEKWRNVQIVLTKLKIPKGQMAKNLIECSGKYCDPLILESIKNILPTEDEEEMVKMYSGDPNELGRPETFYKELMTVPEFAHRVKSLIFASVKDDLYYEISQKMQQLLDGFTSLQNNYRFHHILEVALAIGNYLNGTSLKGGAWGFKLDSIERLEEVKSADGKMNAAYYVIKEVWKKYEYPLFSKDEIEMYSFLSKMPVSQVGIDIGELRKSLASVRKAEKSNVPNSNDCIGKFCEEMKNQLELKIQQFTDTLKQLEQAYSKCATFYCEDSKKLQSDEFGKKIFKGIHFLFESERTYKFVRDKQKKQQDRKAIKSEIKFVQKPENVEEMPKMMKSTILEKSTLLEPTGLPEPPKLPPKHIEPSKQEKLKEYQKAQQKAHEDFIKKRQTKVIAYRNSKAPKGPAGLKNDFDEISFLKGIK